MSRPHFNKKYLIALLFPFIALWGIPTLYVTAKEPITPNNAKDQLLVYGYVRKATNQYTPTPIIERIRQYYTPTPYHKIKYLSHRELPTNQPIDLYLLSKWYCYVKKCTQFLVFHPYDAKGASTKQCSSPFEGTIVAMQEISDNNLIIIATSKPELLLFDLVQARIIRRFKLTRNKNQCSLYYCPTVIYSIGKGHFITLESKNRTWIQWDITKVNPIQGVSMANNEYILYVASMPTSQHILIVYKQEMLLASFSQDITTVLLKCYIYDLKTSSFVAKHTLEQTIPLDDRIHIETQGPFLFIQVTAAFFPNIQELVKIQCKKNKYTFVHYKYQLPPELSIDSGDSPLILFPYGQEQLFVHKRGRVALYTIKLQRTFQPIDTLDVSSFTIGKESRIKKVNNTVVIYGKSGIISLKFT
ncbi:MAG: hypothetical protein AAF770_02500 [Bacteroidota bacterium]